MPSPTRAAWPAALLFVDGDLAETATNLGVLTTAVLDGTADMTIATLPAQLTAGGGGASSSAGAPRHRAPHRLPRRSSRCRGCAA